MYKYSMEHSDATKYLSKSFGKLYHDTEEYQNNSGSLIIDFDIWLRAQDAFKPTYAVKSVKIIDDKNAVAQVSIRDSGYEQTVRVTLVFERGDWYVDNFNTDRQDWIKDLRSSEYN